MPDIKITKSAIEHSLQTAINAGLAIGEGRDEGNYHALNDEFNHLCGIAFEQGDLVHVDSIAAPPGYKLVPIEPSEEMVKAGAWFLLASNGDTTPANFRPYSVRIYKAMLEAAPEKT